MPPEENQGNAQPNNPESNSGLTPESLTNFMKGIETLTASVNKLNALAESGRPQPQQTEETEDDEDEEEDEQSTSFSDVDLETMSRAQLLDFINNNNEKALKRALKAIEDKFAKPIVNQVTNVENSVRAQQLQKEIDSLAGANKDFWDWRDEMIKINNENPDRLSPTRLYHLAKAENPAKAAELAKKYDTSGNGKNERDARKPSFGGFQPGSTSSKQNAKMSTEDALEDAYAQMVSRHGNILSQE